MEQNLRISQLCLGNGFIQAFCIALTMGLGLEPSSRKRELSGPHFPSPSTIQACSEKYFCEYITLPDAVDRKTRRSLYSVVFFPGTDST